LNRACRTGGYSVNYEVVAGNTIVYEMLLSFLLYKRRDNLKYLEKGTGWIEEVNELLDPSFAKELEQLDDAEFWDAACLLIANCPDNRQASGFLRWLQSLSATQMYALLAPLLPEKYSRILLDLEKHRDQFVYYATRWNEQYFRKQELEDVFHKGIEALADAIRSGRAPEEIVADFSRGFSVEVGQVQQVVLIPSIHFSPLHTFACFNDKLFLWYPLRDKSTFEDVLQIGKCLSDRKRLEILRFLSTDKHTFTDVFKKIGGAKGNTHHHLMTLRAAGLVRVHIAGDGQTFYASTRKAFIPELKTKLDELFDN